MLEITTHPGIGDVSWIYSKLANCGRPLKLRIAEDKKTKRALPFAGILPFVSDADYGNVEDYFPLSKCENAFFSDYLKAEKEGKRLFVSANNHLEAGKRLEEYLPDLPTSFHYEINTSPKDAETAQRLLPSGNVVGIYTSSEGGAKNWRGWHEGEWLDFCQRIRRETGASIAILGAGWDTDLSDKTANLLATSGIPHVNLCGQTPMGVAVEVLKRLNYFVGFASGMGILGNVVGKPGLMFYPEHLSKLMTAWPCPVSLGTGRHIGMLWNRPLNVWERCQAQIKNAMN